MATARMPRIMGAFHGAIPTTTPTGWRVAIATVSGKIGRNNFTDEPVRLRRRFAQQSGRENAIEHSPSEGSSHLFGHRPRDLGLAAVKNVRGLEEQAAAHGGRRGAPCGKRGRGGVNRAARIRASGRGKLRNDFAGERIRFLKRTAVVRALPFAVDEQLLVLQRRGVHGISLHSCGSPATV